MAKNSKPPLTHSSLKISWKDLGAEAHGFIGIAAMVILVICVLVVLGALW